MKRKFLFAKGFAFMSIVLMLVLGLSFSSKPQSKELNKIVVTHTYLVKIPYSAGVCPYQLMSMTNGKLQMVNDAGCVCPYIHHTSVKNASLMTARCPDIESVKELLPASIRKVVEIQLADHPNRKMQQRLFTSAAK